MLEIYTAGFLDADGSVSLSKASKYAEDYMRFPEVAFYNCDKGILDTIANRWGGRVSSKKHSNLEWNVSYELRVTGDSALSLLKDVSQYMLHGKKSKRARLILEHYKSCTPRNGKYTTEQIQKKRWLVEEVMGIQMRGVGAY